MKNIAKNIIDKSLKIKAGEFLFLEGDGRGVLLADKINELAKQKKIEVYYRRNDGYEFWKNCTEKTAEQRTAHDENLMSLAQCYVSVKDCEQFNLIGTKRRLYQDFTIRVHNNIRLKKRWLVTQIPSGELSKQTGISLENLEKTYVQSAGMNYDLISPQMKKMAQKMSVADKVKIVSPNTNLEFSIKKVPVVICMGECNLPDGEVYTAPIKNSINGTVAFNAPSPMFGVLHKNIVLTIKNGKIVNAKSSNTKAFEKVLATDAGSCFFGEFALGFNPNLTIPFGNILFDEKIGGSFHMAIGNSYDDAPNENKSAVHWDLVQIQTPNFGGGEIYFDNKLIRKDGVDVD
ncbi:MAG: aminopeptidase [Clostridia bacterium]